MSEWDTLLPVHKWIYDKLLLSHALGYKCGPMGIPVPSSRSYIVKPITNVHGMGLGSTIHLDVPKDTVIAPYQPGYFWMELFMGRHVSVDYENGSPVLVLLGERELYNTKQFTRWSRLPTHLAPILPPTIQDICNHYSHFNAEFIGNRVIEVHCRVGGDSWIFNDLTVDSIIPVWEGDVVYSYEEFTSSYDDANITRLGFKIIRNTLID